MPWNWLCHLTRLGDYFFDSLFSDIVTVHREEDCTFREKRPDVRRHSRETASLSVIPAKAGIQEETVGLHSDTLDSRLRGNDGERVTVNGYQTLTRCSPTPASMPYTSVITVFLEGIWGDFFFRKGPAKKPLALYNFYLEDDRDCQEAPL